jgi:hypothetical protein
MSELQCENCRWWDPASTEPGDGLCRRASPVRVGIHGCWPTTRYRDWCGEFQEKPAPKAGGADPYRSDSEAVITNCPFCDTKLVPLCPKCRPTRRPDTDWSQP